MANLSFGGGGSSYFDLARQRQVFSAYAIVTAPVIWTTAAGTGGPLLWNNTGPGAGGNNRVLAVLLASTCAVTVVSTVAAALGLTGNSGQTSAPTATTAIDASANMFVGGPAPTCNVYRVGTPSSAGNFFLPLAGLSTGALTADNELLGLIDLGGSVVIPPGSWVSLAASATASTTVARLGMLWAEVPY